MVLASVPLRGWDEGSSMSLLHALLLFGGGAVGLMLLVAFLAMAPSAVRRARGGEAAEPWWGTPQWFGGELGAGSAQRPALEAAAASTRTDDLEQVAKGGGASARW